MMHPPVEGAERGGRPILPDGPAGNVSRQTAPEILSYDRGSNVRQEA
jgi:hypothetical protein